MIRYVCKYTPTELFAGFGETCRALTDMPRDFDLSDRVAHANLCGFGKTVIQAALRGEARELVLVNCCDTMRRVYDVLRESGACRFLFLLDLPHKGGCCEREAFAGSLLRLKDDYEAYSGKLFDRDAFLRAFQAPEEESGPYVGILGVRAGPEVEESVRAAIPLPVRNLTCLGGRSLPAGAEELARADGEAALFTVYAAALLSQLPCRRMEDVSGRRRLFEDPNLRGAVYHTIQFCDYYGFEYAEIKDRVDIPLLKLETDYTRGSGGALRTRIEAFAETLGARRGEAEKPARAAEGGYAAGIDSGSASTDVVILDREGRIAASAIIPTGGGARESADTALGMALERAGLSRSDLARIVTTGYGRDYIGGRGWSVTEITCHARGAHHLNPAVRTVIDVGGQDSKVIRLDKTGAVAHFVMNDKCAAGTGRFLEMMARALGLSLEEMSALGLTWKENIVLSSMCTVFAESEVVSLVAQSRAVADIVHGLNNAVAAKIQTLVGRAGGEGEYMMTGGVAKNPGVVRAIEARLGVGLHVPEEAQLCGALGAALIALE
ncbi:MAG TPA: acyl-CoA dehydratase activase [Oscillospiraceae bacterium]|nr:acyl-CoA dehydratase activase [Oscillospiraceae bacterium]